MFYYFLSSQALEAAEILISELELTPEQITAEAFIQEREEKLDKMFPGVDLLPGVTKLIKHLKESGVPIAVATSSHKRHFDLKTTKHKELFALFDVIVTGDQVTQGKPCPEIFLDAAARLSAAAPPGSSIREQGGLKGEDCLVFEDAPAGIEAAVRAGMRSVFVPDAMLDTTGTLTPSLQIKSLEDFEPSIFHLPPYPPLPVENEQAA